MLCFILILHYSKILFRQESASHVPMGSTPLGGPYYDTISTYMNPQHIYERTGSDHREYSWSSDEEETPDSRVQQAEMQILNSLAGPHIEEGDQLSFPETVAPMFEAAGQRTVDQINGGIYEAADAFGIDIEARN